MLFLLQVVAFFIYGFFWCVSTPIYFASDFCQMLDSMLSDVLDFLFNDKGGSGGGGIGA